MRTIEAYEETMVAGGDGDGGVEVSSETATESYQICDLAGVATSTGIVAFAAALTDGNPTISQTVATSTLASTATVVVVNTCNDSIDSAEMFIETTIEDSLDYLKFLNHGTIGL